MPHYLSASGLNPLVHRFSPFSSRMSHWSQISRPTCRMPAVPRLKTLPCSPRTKSSTSVLYGFLSALSSDGLFWLSQAPFHCTSFLRLVMQPFPLRQHSGVDIRRFRISACSVSCVCSTVKILRRQLRVPCIPEGSPQLTLMIPNTLE